ncbi:putative membrane protein [[Clostridium] sordellii ATCC 9714]|nr:putative membrane protein [[Clostridium] sordellii ATCC 9714] [Paeniclostridium sordellii ATCC 9714]
MVALGCILVGLGIGLTLGNMQETIVLSLVGLIVGAFLYTRMGVYIQLKINKK